MLLLGVLAALLAAGLWMYALIDVLLTPGPDCRGPGKGTWLAVTGLLFVPGALAWLILGRPHARPGRYLPGRTPRTPWWAGQPVGLDAEAALRRHPAGRGRPDLPFDLYLEELTGEPDGEPALLEAGWPVGPDDDPDFLRYLDRVVRDIREG